MTKKELMDALKKSKAKPSETIFIWDMDNGCRHDISKVDDNTGHGGTLDLNCNDADYHPREDE